MSKLHNTTRTFYHLLLSLRPVRPERDHYIVRDDSMFPTYQAAQEVYVDPVGAVKRGAVVAVVTEEFVEFRELQIHNGEFFLVPHNKKYPTISMHDFREFYPGAYFAGVVG